MNMREKWRTVRRALGIGTDHEAGRVAQRERWQAEGVAQLHEARGLVGAVGVDRAAQVRRIVGDHAERPPFDAGERRHHAGAEAGAQLQHRARRRPASRSTPRTS